MKFYRIAQHRIAQQEVPTIQKEELEDRTRYYLVDSKGNKVGKLVVQGNLHPQYYQITGFKIDKQYQGQHLGTKLMNEFLNDSRFKDRPALVFPLPYEGESQDEMANLRDMYKHFGFHEAPNWGNYLLLERT